MMTTGKTEFSSMKEFILQELHQHPEDIHEWLRVVMEDYEQDGDLESLMRSLEIIAEAQNRSHSDHSTLPDDAKIGWNEVLNLLKQNGYTLSIQRTA